MKPVLFIMCGLPFSGKTVLAQKLSEHFDNSVISIDSIREEFGFSWEDNEKVTPADWDKVFTAVHKRIGQELDLGHSVIYDSANQDRASRDDLRAFAKKHNATTKIIYLDVPLEVIMKRWQENQHTKTRFHLPMKWLRAAIDTLEPPKSDEKPYVYCLQTTDQDIFDQIELSHHLNNE